MNFKMNHFLRICVRKIKLHYKWNPSFTVGYIFSQSWFHFLKQRLSTELLNDTAGYCFLQHRYSAVAKIQQTLRPYGGEKEISTQHFKAEIKKISNQRTTATEEETPWGNNKVGRDWFGLPHQKDLLLQIITSIFSHVVNWVQG